MTLDPLIGSVIGGCRIDAEIGRGGMGVVYRGEQLALGRTVAVKVLSPALAHDEQFRARFHHEARTAASLDHPNVVPIHEAGAADGHLYLVMRYVAGTDLRSLLAREGALAPARAARIVAQVAAALDAAHAAGLVHRDVKPANVLLGSEAAEHVYLSDFGLTKLADATGLTRTGEWLGTPDYVAPEQIEGGRLDARSDVYALGCVLYAALTGAAPYLRDATVAKLWAHVNEPPPAPTERDASIPTAFDGIVASALAKDPAERYASAGGLGRAAVAAAEGRLVIQEDRSVATGEASPTAATLSASHAQDAPGGAPPRVVPPARTRVQPVRTQRSVAPTGGSRRTIVALALAAAALLVGGLVGATVLRSDTPASRSIPTAAASAAAADSSGARVETRTTTTKARPARAAVGTTPDAAATDATFDRLPDTWVPHVTHAFTVDRPADWRTAKDDVRENDAPRYRSQWISDACGCDIVIDSIPGYGLSALANAEEVPGGTKAPTTIGTFEDAALRTAEEDGRHLATYFVAVDGDNYAVRATAPSFDTALAVAGTATASLAPFGE